MSGRATNKNGLAHLRQSIFLFGVGIIVEVFGGVFSDQPQQAGDQSSDNPFD